MPTMKCPYCNQIYEIDSVVIGQKVRCAICKETFVVVQEKIYVLQPQQAKTTPTESKRRAAYIAWGLFLGHLGFHDFYAELHLLGFIHLGLCFLSGFSSIVTGETCPEAMILSYILTIIELFIIKKDGKGLSMK